MSLCGFIGAKNNLGIAVFAETSCHRRSREVQPLADMADPRPIAGKPANKGRNAKGSWKMIHFRALQNRIFGLPVTMDTGLVAVRVK